MGCNLLAAASEGVILLSVEAENTHTMKDIGKFELERNKDGKLSSFQTAPIAFLTVWGVKWREK